MDKTTAWMLRQDGTAFPCQWHYYGSADPAEVEETLYAAEWLYDATQSEETRQLCLDLIAAYGVALRPNRNLVRNLLLAILERPYVFLSRAFVERHAGELFYVDPARLPELNAAVNRALNSEFLRVRLGGLYCSLKLTVILYSPSHLRSKYHSTESRISLRSNITRRKANITEKSNC